VIAPHNVLTPTRHGLMLAGVHDRYVGTSLIAYGEFSQHEVDFLADYIGPGDIVLDVGANIGALTIPFARMAGSVIAFEPQRGCHMLLSANIALNSLVNVIAYQYAVGNPEGGSGDVLVPFVDYTRPGNFGSVSLTAPAEKGEMVLCVALDALGLPPAKLLKIDVEGMEAEVLRGARNYVTTHMPYLYVENDRDEKASELVALIRELGYDAYWHRPPLYNPANFKRNPENRWPNVLSLNLFCVPSGSPMPSGVVGL
jgi:FkbM family methyltransferase